MRRYSPWRAGDLRGERGGSGCLGVRHHLVVPGVGAPVHALGPARAGEVRNLPARAGVQKGSTYQ